MADPFNQLPRLPEWEALADRLTDEAAEQLGCMVVLVVIQPEGKMGVCASGVPPTGPFAEMASNIPKLLRLLAHITESMDEAEKARGPVQ